jgi:hypothetical protein
MQEAAGRCPVGRQVEFLDLQPVVFKSCSAFSYVERNERLARRSIPLSLKVDRVCN